MTPDEINKVIAEKVGWRFVKVSADGLDDGCWLPPGALHDANVFEHCEKSPPRYSEDLNACVEFEEALVGTDRRTLYLDHLYAIACDDGAQKWEREWFTVAAKAPQRCEAFLRAIGKWRQS